jgi:hypothetical protein
VKSTEAGCGARQAPASVGAGPWPAFCILAFDNKKYLSGRLVGKHGCWTPRWSSTPVVYIERKRETASEFADPDEVEPMFTDVTSWFAELDRLALKPFMPEGRQQPPAPQRDVFDDDRPCLMPNA